ncbi:MAG: transposase [Dehalococcoidia bacterium]
MLLSKLNLETYSSESYTDFMSEGIRILAETLMEVEVREKVGVYPYQRSPHRRTYRNGYREKLWCTHLGDIVLRIPKLRNGSYFPSFLEPDMQAEHALLSIVQEVYAYGVNRRSVMALLHTLGLDWMSSEAVTEIGQVLDEEIRRRGQRFASGQYHPMLQRRTS